MVWIIIALVSMLALLLLSGCKPTITEVLLSVPYRKVQGKDWCLPASGEMVFSHYGESVSQADIAKEIIEGGVSNIYKMVNYARDLGFNAVYNYINIKKIEGYLREGVPLIVIQKYSMTVTKSHCRVIIGFDSVKRELILHDSAGKSNYKISYKTFFDLGFDSNEISRIIVMRRK